MPNWITFRSQTVKKWSKENGVNRKQNTWRVQKGVCNYYLQHAKGVAVLPTGIIYFKKPYTLNIFYDYIQRKYLDEKHELQK